MRFTMRKSRENIVVACIAVLFAAMLVLGIILDQENQEAIGYYLIGIVALLAAPIFIILSLLTKRIRNCHLQQMHCLSKEELKKLYFIIVIVWLLGYLAMFPGVYGTDAPYWYYEFSHPEVPISSQWSPIYAGAFYCFVEIGRRFFDSSAVIGFGIFSFVQMAFVLFGVWKVVFFLNNKIGKYAAIAGVIFFAVVPTHNILAVTSAQDSLFAVSFAMCLMHLIEIASEGEAYFSDWKKAISFIVWLLFSCVIRNNGLYALLVLCFFVLLFAHKYKIRVLSILLCVITLTLVYQGPIYSYLGVQKGTAIREMLSLPLQQMGFSYKYTDDIPDNLKLKMQRYMEDEDWLAYEPCISDQLKSRLKTDMVKENPWDFLKLYLKVGLNSPRGYIEGVLYQTYGLWYPFKEYPDSKTWHPYMIYVSSDTYGLGFMIPRKSLLPVYDKILGWLFGLGESKDGYGGNLFMGFSEIPVWSLLCKAGTYVWLIIYILAYSIIYRRWLTLIPLGYILGLLLTVFLSPVILYRYVAPIIFSGPLIVALLFFPIQMDDKNRT